MLFEQLDGLLQIDGVDHDLHELSQADLAQQLTDVLVELVGDELVGRLAYHVVELGLRRVEALGEAHTVVHKLLDLDEYFGHTGAVGHAAHESAGGVRVLGQVECGGGGAGGGQVELARKDLDELVIGLLVRDLHARVVVLIEYCLDLLVPVLQQHVVVFLPTIDRTVVNNDG